MKLKRGGPQRGGVLLGLVIGLLIGLAAALAVALYVSKVPVPFLNKVPQRTAEQDAAEAERNKNWDPNSGLYGKNPARPSSMPGATYATPPATGAAPVGALPDTAIAPPINSPMNPGGAAYPAPGPIMPGPDATAVSPAPRTMPRAASRPGSDPAGVLAIKPSAPVATAVPTVPPAGNAPAGALTDPFSYFVQVGAYSRTEEAEQQRAKLAMLGFGAKVTEREQSGRTVYRVRIGPFETRHDAESNQTRIQSAGVEAALVRVQK
jgi:cell division protein FtsN